LQAHTQATQSDTLTLLPNTQATQGNTLTLLPNTQATQGNTLTLLPNTQATQGNTLTLLPDTQAMYGNTLTLLLDTQAAEWIRNPSYKFSLIPRRSLGMIFGGLLPPVEVRTNQEAEPPIKHF
jgi:hypothetical protein